MPSLAKSKSRVGSEYGELRIGFSMTTLAFTITLLCVLDKIVCHAGGNVKRREPLRVALTGVQPTANKPFHQSPWPFV
jgi:hypothetical protein